MTDDKKVIIVGAARARKLAMIEMAADLIRENPGVEIGFGPPGNGKAEEARAMRSYAKKHKDAYRDGGKTKSVRRKLKTRI